MNEKWYPVGELLKQMKAAGASWWSRDQLKWLEKKGLIRLPRLNYGRKDRRVTQGMIDEIIAAFQPGGDGFWYSEGYEEKH